MLNSSLNVQIKSDSNQRTKEEINEGFLSVLRLNRLNLVEMGFIDIINPFEKELITLIQLCESKEVNIEQIIEFLEKTEHFDLLSRSYKYCEILAGSYQGFYAENQSFLASVKKYYQTILFNQKENPKDFDIYGEITRLKLKISENYQLWCNAYAIEIAYNKCSSDQNILTYSHRITGWSNPVYQLTPNFSVELKTNFGYGSVSYFYTKLKYKNIDITPFSDWILYQSANFNELIRYSKSHLLQNSSWHEAMSFAKDACNLSLSNEVGFVGKYIIGECETMVAGLEKILYANKFSFKNGKDFIDSTITGHKLVVFRGEKIAGALDFISKILEFDGIANMKEFVTRIEKCNKSILPFLLKEIIILKDEIDKSTQEKDALQPQYNSYLERKRDYQMKCEQLKTEMLAKGELELKNLDKEKLSQVFVKRFPEYETFRVEYNLLKDRFVLLTQIISNCTEFKRRIELDSRKINEYFGN